MHEEEIDPGKEKKVFESLIKSYHSSTDKKEQLEILQELGVYYKYMKSPKYRNILFLVLQQHSDPHIRRDIMKSFSYSKDKEVLKPLILAMHNDKDPYARFDAARTIGTLKFREAIPALMKTIQKERIKRIRDEAAYSIGLLEDESAIPFLSELVKKDDDIHNTAALAISRINGKEAVRTLIDLLTIRKIENLWYVIYALELLRKKAQEAAPFLCKLARNHAEESIQVKAIDAMGYIGGKRAIDFLEEGLKKEHDVKKRFWYALSHGRIFGLDSLGARELLKQFAFDQIDDDQMTEYVLLCRWFVFDMKKESSDSSKDDDISKTTKKIKNGESEYTEFKEHLLWNKHTQQINKEMRLKLALTISSFMNSDGGIIFLGIDNDHNVVGLEKDMSLLAKGKQNKDGIQLYITEIIKQYIGLKFRDYYRISFEEIEGKVICKVNVKHTPNPIFVKNNTSTNFAIRVEGSKEILDTKEAVEYCRLHW